MPSLGGSGNLGRLVAELGLDTSDLDKGGANAKRTLGGIRSEMRSLINTGGKVAVSLGAVGAALAVNLVERAGEAAREIRNLSQVAGASTREFQRNAYAARQFGVESDKLADIYKDVQDRVGDFLQTGAGPMADFFEKIAPQVGVTAAEFANLSGPAAMQKYVDSLQRANVNQAEMTFFLEAIAGDASRLIPLLRDGGAEMGRLGDEAERVNAVLSDIQIDALVRGKESIDRLKQSMSGAANVGTAVLAPAIEAIAEGLNETLAGALSESEGDFLDWGETVGNILAFAADAVNGAVKTIGTAFQSAGDTFGAQFAAVAAVVKGEFGQLDDIGADWLANQREMWSALANDSNLSTFRDKLEEIRNRQREVGEGAGRIASAVGGGEREAIPRSLSDFGFTGQRILTHDKPEIEGLGPTQQELDEELERLRQFAMSEAEILTERHETRLAQLEKQLEEENILEDEYRSLREELEAGHLEKMNELRKKSMTDAERFEAMGIAARIQTITGGLAKMTAGVAQQNEKLFKLNKAAALAEAAVALPKAVLDSFKNAGGYPWGLIPAAAMAATGLAQINAIRSATFNGGGGGLAPSQAGTPATPVASAGGEGGPSRQLFIQGLDEGSLFSGKAVRRLLEEIGQASEDGTRVVIG